MPLPIIPGTVRATYRGLLPNGQQWANVMHFRYAAGASSPGPADIVALDALAVRLYTGASFGGGGITWLAACNAATTLIDATYYLLNGLSPPQVILHPATGVGAGVPCPPEVAYCLTLRSAVRGRSYRGRAFLPAPTTAQVVAPGVLTAATLANFLIQANALPAALGGAGAPFWEAGIASYLHSTFQPLAAYTMDNVADVIRRRKG